MEFRKQGVGISTDRIINKALEMCMERDLIFEKSEEEEDSKSGSSDSRWQHDRGDVVTYDHELAIMHDPDPEKVERIINENPHYPEDEILLFIESNKNVDLADLDLPHHDFDHQEKDDSQEQNE